MTASVTAVTVSTDRRFPSSPGGGRMFRSPGKGRKGTHLVVEDASGEVVLSHNSAHGFRTNDEVEKWLANQIQRNERA